MHQYLHCDYFVQQLSIAVLQRHETQSTDISFIRPSTVFILAYLTLHYSLFVAANVIGETWPSSVYALPDKLSDLTSLRAHPHVLRADNGGHWP